MENGNDYEKLKERGISDFGLAGRFLNTGSIRFPLKLAYVYTPEQTWTLEIQDLIKNAKTNDDLDAIGSKFMFAINNHLSVDIFDYQIQASKKMREVYENKRRQVYENLEGKVD